MLTKKLIYILAIFPMVLLLSSVIVEPYKQIGTVSAAATSEGCCSELKNGAICENILTTDASSCKTSLLSTSCSQVDSCKLGCCIDTARGTCAYKSPNGKCTTEGGKWVSGVNCEISECNKACCILGEKIQLVTEKDCEKLSLFYGFKKNFRADLKNEADCLQASKTQETGSCIYTSKASCDSTTKEQCTSMGGTFYKNIPCSNPSLQTNCTKQASIGCVEGKDEIYWFDSCGNRENIYSSDRTASWNNGKTLTKAQSCNPTSSNIDSTTCGNCNRALSSTCAPSTIKHVVDGNFICKNLKCVDAEGNIRENGESWCVYDSYIGDGKDTVGSEHWRAYCDRGKIEVDVCTDYRGKICVQSITESGGKELSIASCIENPASECLTYNSKPATMKTKCNANEHCLIKRISVAAGFDFEVCIPHYPKGFDKTETELNEKVCDLASKTCMEKWVKDWRLFRGFVWKCAANCECETETFSKQMNDLCTSMGDCGSEINFKGSGTDNTIVIGAPATHWEDYIKYKTPVQGKYATSDDPEGDALTYGRPTDWGYSFGNQNWWSFFALGGIRNVLLAIGGYGSTEDRPITFKCLPWEAPLGNEDCEKCQDDPQRACTEYRCSSLGQGCILLNPEDEYPECKSLTRETNAPNIFTVNTSKGYKFKDIIENGATLVGETKDCIREFTPVSFTLGTDEHAQCIASLTFPISKKFEEMDAIIYPTEQNAFKLTHTFNMSLPSLSSLNESGIEGDLRDMYANMKMYIRCRDYWGNYNIDEYIINFCVNPGPDLTPVSSITPIPPTGTILPYGKKEMNVNFYLNEPAECKYSTVSEKEYEEMESSMTCETNVLNPTPLGWECNMIMPLLEEENKIYVKCKDQPWFAGTINETDRNVNQEDYEYVLYVSGSELNITGTFPTGIIEIGPKNKFIELEARTVGGAYEGVALCYLGETLSTPFSETFSTIHKHNLTVVNGAYNLPVECEDSVGNIATSAINFSVDLQTSAPIVTRAYREGGNLIILTNKKAECYYDLQTCNFDIVNGTLMTTGLSTTHIAPWDIGKTYSIKCMDAWENVNSQCAIKVKPN